MVTITYFAKYLCKYLDIFPRKAEEIVSEIRNKETGCEFLNSYYRISEDFLHSVIAYLVKSGRLLSEGGYLYPSEALRKEIEAGVCIVYEGASDKLACLT